MGHTQSPGDSVHSTIERAARDKDIFTQDDWMNLMKQAKVEKTKYKVKQKKKKKIFILLMI